MIARGNCPAIRTWTCNRAKPDEPDSRSGGPERPAHGGVGLDYREPQGFKFLHLGQTEELPLALPHLNRPIGDRPIASAA
jgi:hypothetical protein